MSSLVGKHAVITGGSRGIGLAIAHLFASEGASCTLIGRNADRLNEAKSLLPTPNSLYQPHAIQPFDVSHIDGWQALAKGANRDTKFDILVNAAGVSQNSLLSRTAASDMQQIVNINLMGTMYGCGTIVPKMMKQRSGCIINLSSLLATHGGQGASVYAASKAGVVALTRSLAWEVGRFGIRANVLSPGYIQTDMTKDLNKNGELAARIPLGRLGLEREVAEAADFLAKNAYAHNCVLNIDGGLSAGLGAP
ncbi:NAD(P)-binding protein [Xylariomycetidae sp. FL0641]|nr:NAD(P)-binding protein [Xylariomycetidae sp. FL0641]